MKVWLKRAFVAGLLFAGVAQANEPVVFVLAASDKVVVSNPKGQQYSALPTQRLLHGHTVAVPKGQRFSVLVLNTGNRRVYNGPAQLKVIADTVRVLSGPAVKVFPVEQAHLDLIDQWINLYARPRGVLPVKGEKAEATEDKSLRVLRPIDGSLLLTRNPEFVFQGDLPREGNLMLFDSKGKRFWVEPLESEYVSLPPAAKFEWGQSFTWEVRRLTGGRVVSGSFHIASEETARSLLEARVPDTAGTMPEAKLFYGMRLQLAKAFKEANEVWESLGMELTTQGQPSRIRP
ncbi:MULTISPECIES: hypothetical protein [unclassified Limnobacter]|uniref:hypothetical protein n=1 Tax=unclassified Limnobacter TaxID=2630203 RepID=UPI0025C1BBDB|nr:MULTISPECIES: hypothetical protein [unclassified Limnobacter]